MHPPSVEQLGDQFGVLRKETPELTEDSDAILEHLAKLRTLAVYLNVHLTAPTIHEA